MILLLALPGLLASQTPSASAPAASAQPMPVVTAPTLPNPDKTVITVNGHAIPAKDLEAYVYDWNASQVGEYLITKELVEEEASKKNVKVTDTEVSAAVLDYYRQIQPRVPKGQTAEEALKLQGYPASKIALGARLRLLVERIAALDFKPEEYVKVASIMIQPKDQTATSLTAALKSAGDAYAALQKGDPWDSVVMKYTTLQQAAADHGERNWVRISLLPKEVQHDAATLKVKGFTQPVQSQRGIEIFYIEARGKEATPGEMSALKAQYLPALESELVSRLRTEAKITTSYTP